MDREPNPCLLIGYIEEALSDDDMARVEAMLRSSLVWRQALEELRNRSDLGEHSVGMIWRRQRLTCPDRERLWAYRAGGLMPDEEDFLRFHLETVKCPWCQASLRDLDAEGVGKGPTVPDSGRRRRRFFETSVGQLPRKP